MDALASAFENLHISSPSTQPDSSIGEQSAAQTYSSRTRTVHEKRRKRRRRRRKRKRTRFTRKNTQATNKYSVPFQLVPTSYRNRRMENYSNRCNQEHKAIKELHRQNRTHFTSMARSVHIG